MVILTKFHKDWAKIVDYLIKAHFSMCPIFFGPDFIILNKEIWKDESAHKITLTPLPA